VNEKGERDRFLSKDEEDNLNIMYGTLMPKEREIINHHIVATIKMLEALPWPRHLTNVPEYAGGHHERMDGKGYPRGLKREQMSVQARLMGIADIFEALTAKDRPYKPARRFPSRSRSSGRCVKQVTSTRTSSTSSCARRSTCATPRNSSIPTRSTTSTSRRSPATPRSGTTIAASRPQLRPGRRSSA
jgi:hypothetical protein